MMIFSVFPGGAGSSGTEGGGGELFDFPMTIDEYPPDSPGQGRREGHLWFVMSKALAAQVHTLMFDGYGRAVEYPPGTLLLIVPKLGESKIYVNRAKEAGAAAVPMVYQPGSDPLETHWPVTLINQDGAQGRVEISRPEGHARLITETGWENIPVYYFNGAQWEAPETWDYLYWDATRNTSTGVDTMWQAFKLDTETFLPIRRKVPELSLTEIVKAIRAGNNNTEPQQNVTVFPGGWAVLGLTDTRRETRNDTAHATMGHRRFVYDGSAPHWYFLEITKKQVSYLGKMEFAADMTEGRYPYQIITIGSRRDQVRTVHRDWLGCFYQMSSVDKGAPTHISFRKYWVDREHHRLTYWETNAAALNETVVDAVFLDNDSGYLLTVQPLNPAESESSGTSKYFCIHYFLIKGDMLVLRKTSFPAVSVSVAGGCRSAFGNLNLQTPHICGPLCGGVYTNNYRYCELYSYVIDEDHITFRRIAGGSWTASGSYTDYTAPMVRDGSTRFYITYRSRNSNGAVSGYTTYEYELTVSALGAASFKQLTTYSYNCTGLVNYYSEIYWPHYTVNLPGARQDEVVWLPNSVQKTDPANPNALLDPNSFGITAMIPYANIGGLGNLAVSSQLPDR